MMIKSLIALLATSALAMKLVRHLSDRHQLRRAHDEHRLQREDVHRWEGEGGHLPSRSQVPR